MRTHPIAIATLLGLTPVMLALVGCSRDQSLVCSQNVAYLEAREEGPLRVPDGLTVPDEVEALRIPGRPGAGEGTSPAETAADSNCLELSPAFSLPAEQ